VIVPCQTCGARLKTSPARIADGRGKYCSRICAGAAKAAARPAPDYDALKAALEDGLIPEPNTGCMLWDGRAHSEGYGILEQHGRRYYAHRLALRFAGTDVPKGACVCHRCDTPACANPAHLFIGTRGENTKDMWAKGRGNPGAVAPEKHHRRKLTREIVAVIRGLNEPVSVVAARYGITKTHVHTLRSGKGWKS
jgi:hypothetical protein